VHSLAAAACFRRIVTTQRHEGHWSRDPWLRLVLNTTKTDERSLKVDL